VPPTYRRRWFFAALYFSEGAPIGWLWWTLPSQLRQSGVEVASITALTAALAIPWACKFLWAPLVDLLQTRWFGLRAWLLIAQLGMAATLLPMLSIDPVADWRMLFGWLLAHAFFAATQDVAIDAMAIRSVPTSERGSLNGAMQVGMIGGRVLFSSGVLYLSAATGERLAVPMLLAVILGTLPGRRMRYLRVLLATPRFWRLVVFALIGGAGFEAAGSLSGSWLVDRGFEANGIATFRLISAVLMAIGAWLGGRMADHQGARFVTRTWLVALASLLAATALCDLAPMNSVAAICYAITYFAIGAFTAGSYALFMQNANGPLAATVFSAFMGSTNACEAWAGKLGGEVQRANGYGASLLLMATLSLLALLLLPRQRRS
jgi:MFS transporter, PAT family, beta-lactamase induction signal transducer AmpG